MSSSCGMLLTYGMLGRLDGQIINVLALSVYLTELIARPRKLTIGLPSACPPWCFKQTCGVQCRFSRVLVSAFPPHGFCLASVWEKGHLLPHIPLRYFLTLVRTLESTTSLKQKTTKQLVLQLLGCVRVGPSNNLTTLLNGLNVCPAVSELQTSG